MVERIVSTIMVMVVSAFGAHRLAMATDTMMSEALATKTCMINGGNEARIRVNLGKIDGNVISQIGDRSPWMSFSEPIVLTGCPVGQSISLELHSTLTEPGFSDYIALAPGGASGVAIALSIDDGASVHPVNKSIPLTGNGEIRTLNLKAAYVRTQRYVRFGLVNAKAHFLLNYK